MGANKPPNYSEPKQSQNSEPHFPCQNIIPFFDVITAPITADTSTSEKGAGQIPNHTYLFICFSIAHFSILHHAEVMEQSTQNSSPIQRMSMYDALNSPNGDLAKLALIDGDIKKAHSKHTALRVIVVKHLVSLH